MVCNKEHECLFCLRTLACSNIDVTLLSLFYGAFIEPVLFVSMVACLTGGEVVQLAGGSSPAHSVRAVFWAAPAKD